MLTAMRVLASRLLGLFRRRHFDTEMDEEFQSHLEMLADRFVSQGMTRDEALIAAKRQFGGVTQIKEELRESHGLVFLESLWRDVRFGLRVLRRSPGFSTVAILTLAVGIGATTAIFSVINTVILKPLPFAHSERLVRISSVLLSSGRGGVASYPDFLDWRTQNHVFEEIAVFRTGDFTLIGRGQPDRLQGAVVSAQLFELLAVAPVLGRNFLPAEDAPGSVNGTDPVILSRGLWDRQFGSDKNIIGRPIQLSNRPFTVVGVMPEGFQFPIQAERIELWTTIGVDAVGGEHAMTAQRGAHYLDVIALLKPRLALRQAQAEMVTITSRLNHLHPENKPRTVRIVPELQRVAGDLRIPLFVLLAAVTCVLLIVCANVGNLLMARATGRYKEMALRCALGASRRRAVAQLFTETLLLALMGGSLGLALALWSLRFLVSRIPADIPRLDSISLDGHTLSFALLVSIATGILFGTVPALQVGRANVAETLKESGRGSSVAGKTHSRVRSILVAGQVGSAVVLLVAAALLIQSFLHLMQADPGFNPHSVLTFQLDSPAGMPQSWFFRDVVTRMTTLHDVTSASAVASLPLTGDNISSGIEIEGEPTPPASRPTADFNAVEPGYFRTLSIPILRGRDFTEFDDLKSPPVAIINHAMAQRFFPNQNPLGKHLRPGIGNGYGPGEPPMRLVVGVIGDVKQSSVGSEAAPEIYAPLAQAPFSPMFIVVRTSDAENLIAPARRLIASIDKTTPLYHVKTLDDYFADSTAKSRFTALLLSAFAGLAVFLASLGVYGVTSYMVVQRTHELGVRIALGAEPTDVVRWVLGRQLLLACTGVLIGLAVSFGLAHLLSTLLYGIGPTDPVTFGGASMALMAVAAAASYLPARRAAKVDPMVALRYE